MVIGFKILNSSLFDVVLNAATLASLAPRNYIDDENIDIFRNIQSCIIRYIDNICYMTFIPAPRNEAEPDIKPTSGILKTSKKNGDGEYNETLPPPNLGRAIFKIYEMCQK